MIIRTWQEYFYTTLYITNKINGSGEVTFSALSHEAALRGRVEG